MKHSLRSKYHLLIYVLVGLVLLESLLLLVTLAGAKDLTTLIGDLHTILIVFVFIIFIFSVVVYNYIPIQMKKSLSQVNSLIGEISQGNYQVSIDTSLYDSDKDIQSLLHGLQKMLNILLRFDQSKAEKIFEHHQRLLQLINLIPDGIIIAMANGDVKYCNDEMRRIYPDVTETVNINELHFRSEFEHQVFGKISDSLRLGNNLYNQKIPDTGYQRQAVINGSIVRNRKGNATGGVFIITQSEHVQQD